MSAVPGCVLCEAPGQAPATDVVVLWRNPQIRLVRVLDAPAFPAFYRVIWQAHVAEWSELSPPDRLRLMAAVTAVESVLRARLSPTKINMASLGNVVPHLHWHVVARFDWDSHFPNPIWGQALRQPEPPALDRLGPDLPGLDAAVVAAVAAAVADGAP